MSKLKITEKFGVTPNEILNSKELSFKAKGLFGYIQSKPNGWEFSAEKIQSQTKDGLDSVIGAIKELEDAGLLTRERYQDELGHWHVDYRLENPYRGKPNAGFPVVGIPLKGKPPNISKQDIVNKTSKKDIDILPYQVKSTPLGRLKKFYSRLYREQFGIEPKVYLNGKDGSVLKSLLKDYTEYQIAALFIEHFECDDYKLKDAAYPITWISPRVNQYATAINNDIDFSNSVQVKEIVDRYVKNLSKEA